MANITITAEYTTTTENLTAFAKAKGWTETVMENQINENGSAVQVEVDNPKTTEQYAKDLANDCLLNFISQPLVESIIIAKELEKNEAIEQAKSDIAQNLTVN